MIKTIGILLLLFLSGNREQSFAAQLDEPAYFHETGHTLQGEFKDFYYQVPNPESVFGFPTTEAFIDSGLKGVTVQYFQRALFELHPNAPAGERVKLSAIGRYLHEAGQPLEDNINPSACRYFPETGYKVCYAFLDFFDAHGGVAVFGYPISNFELLDGRIIQHFENVRFAWHPDSPDYPRVQLSDLGEMYFITRNEDPRRKDPVPFGNAPQQLLSLNVRAFTAKAITSRQDTQTLYVIVQDQTLQPVSKANVQVRVLTPAGGDETLLMPPTDEKGVSKLTFSLDTTDIGVVELRVGVSADTEFKEETLTSFRVWW